MTSAPALLACVALACGDSDGDDGPRDAAAGTGGTDVMRDAGGAGRDSAVAGRAAGAGGAGADAGRADDDAGLPVAGSASPSSPVSYSNDVAPIFDAKCIDCHHTGSATRLDLTQPFDMEIGLVNRMNTWLDSPLTLLVEPGHPENSFLIKKLIGEGLDHEGYPMPWQVPRLTEDEIAVLETWIADGALDDDLYREEVVLIFGDGMTLGSKSGRCAWCHYEGGDLRPNLMNPFDPETGAVDLVGAYGRVLIEPGDPENSLLIQKVRGTFPAGLGRQMPLQHDPVTEDELAIIEQWIAEGAEDN